MVPPRLKCGASEYWLRARSGNRHGGKVIVTVDSLYNTFKDIQAVRTRASELSTTSTGNAASASVAGPETQPVLRQSARLFNKRAALLRCTRGGPQYWLRTRGKGHKRSLLVSVKSLYTAPSDTAESNVNARRNRPRLFERRAASLLSCRARRPAAFGHRRTARFKRKRKQMYWLSSNKGTPCMGSSTVHPGTVDRSRDSISESKVIFSLMLGASLRRLQLLGTGLLARCLSTWPELRRLSLTHLLPSLVKPNQWPRPTLLLHGHGDVNNNTNKARANQRFVLQRLTELGEEDLLQSILETLPAATLLQAARVCRSWARLCEPAFKAECHREGWSLPRLPRGATPAFPWRSLYYRHACRACGKVGEFHVRKTLNGNFQFLLCRGCIRLPGVRDRLVQYSIDLYGVTGKLLVPSINIARHTS